MMCTAPVLPVGTSSSSERGIADELNENDGREQRSKNLSLEPLTRSPLLLVRTTKQTTELLCAASGPPSGSLRLFSSSRANSVHFDQLRR
jgi:hypothetical protein